MISLLVVNYRAAALAAEAIRTARAATIAPLQVVVVDNSCDEAEAAALQGLADTLVVSDTNRGYAGAINLGRPKCEGETIVVANPDVTFAPGAIDRLQAALGGKTAVAGPALFWDDAHEWHLPPADRSTSLEKLDEVLASRSRAWFEQRDRRRFRRRVAFWSLRETTHVQTLSGAVMAIRAADFDDLGGFDERFRLYFEETDFLRRAIAHHRRIAYVPAARCRHLYNQSAGQTADAAAAAYAESERRYLEKWSGPLVARVLKKLERGGQAILPIQTGEIACPPLDVVVEASPLPSFATAAGHFPRGPEVTLPPEVLRSLRNDFYLRTVVRATGEVLATVRIPA